MSSPHRCWPSVPAQVRKPADGLRALRADLGDRFRLGIIAYLGQDVRVIDQTIVAVPPASLLGAG